MSTTPLKDSHLFKIAESVISFCLKKISNLVVWPCDIQTHLGLRLQPNNMTHFVPKPRPQATFINSYYATSSGSHLVICFPNKKVIAQPYYLSVVRQCRGASLPSMSTEVGTISKAILTTPHSHLNIHLQLTILDLPLH